MIFSETLIPLAFSIFHEKSDVIFNRVSLVYHCSKSDYTDLGSINVDSDRLQLHDIIVYGLMCFNSGPLILD